MLGKKINVRRKPKVQPRMNNPETQRTLGTRHRAKTNTTQKKITNTDSDQDILDEPKSARTVIWENLRKR